MAMLADRVRQLQCTVMSALVRLDGEADADCRPFSAAFFDGDVVYYTIQGIGEYEVGTGRLVAGSPWQLLRDNVLTSSEGCARVTFFGKVDVWCDAPADALMYVRSQPTKVAVGGLPAGSVPSGSVVELLDSVLYAESDYDGGQDVFIGAPATLPARPALVFDQVEIDGQVCFTLRVSDGIA